MSARRCPECRQMSTTAHIRAWLVYGTIPVVFADNGEIIANGPITPTVLVKQGAETRTQNVKLVCPNCSHVGLPDDFITVIVCALSGESANSSMEVHGVGRLNISDDMREVADRMFARPLNQNLDNIFDEV